MSTVQRKSGDVTDGLDREKLHFVDLGGIRTRYYEDGEGEPLVLVHGGEFASLSSLDTWSRNLPGLANDFRTIAVDRLGQGHTDNPETNEDYTWERMFEYVHGFVQTMGITNGNFVGHSRGALPMGWLALEHPGLVKKLVLVDSDTLAPELPMFPSGTWYRDHPVPGGEPTLEKVGVQLKAMAHNPEHVSDDLLGRLLEIALLPKRKDAQYRMSEIGETVWMSSLQRKRKEAIRRIEDEGFPMPTLLIWALNDKSAPYPKGLQLFERIAAKTQHAEMHVINGASHQVFREQPEIFNRVVRDFLRG